MSGFIASLILSCINDNTEAFRISGLLFFNFNIKVGIKESILDTAKPDENSTLTK